MSEGSFLFIYLFIFFGVGGGWGGTQAKKKYC